MTDKSKTISARITTENYNKLMKFLEQLSKKEGKYISASEYVWKAVKFYTSYLVKHKNG